MVHGGHLRWQRFPDLLACHAGRRQCAPRVTVTQHDHVLIARVQLGQHHGRFIGFGSAVREERFAHIAGRDLRQARGHT